MKEIRIDGKTVLVNMDKVCAIAENYIQFDGGHIIWGKVDITEEDHFRHGHWVKALQHWYRCSICYHLTNTESDNYCSNCGAKMDEVTNEID